MSGSSLAPRPPQHLGLQATLGAIFGFGVAYAVGFDGPTCVASASLAAVSVRVALIDLKLRIIRDRDALALLTIGSAWTAWYRLEPASDLALALIQGITYAITFQAVRMLYLRVRGREGMGFGDVKLAAASGPLLTPDNFGLAVFISSILGITFLLLRTHLKHRIYSRDQYLPFGCFLSLSVYAIWFVTPR